MCLGVTCHNLPLLDEFQQHLANIFVDLLVFLAPRPYNVSTMEALVDYVNVITHGYLSFFLSLFSEALIMVQSSGMARRGSSRPNN